MDSTHDALSLSYEQWKKLVVDDWSLPRFRADQLCQWIYQKKVFNIEEMTNLSKELRSQLADKLIIFPPILLKEQKSKDGTRKYLWQLEDGERVETVLLDHGNHTTACISSQVGCPLGCTFCATGMSGFVRNLTTGEIIGQFLAMEKRLGKDINNIVYMGMGEPFLNTDNVFASIRTLNDPKMRNLGGRHFTISTSGIIQGIKDLSDFEVPVRLSVSLHATNDALRTRLMPSTSNVSLRTLFDALELYSKRTGERITFEYMMIDKINDTVEHAYELVSLLNGTGAYVNLIPYNPVTDAYARSTDASIKAFCAILTKYDIEFELRREKGTDIDAACGQLRRNNA